MATVPFMIQIGTVELVLANVEFEIRTSKKSLICGLFSLNDQNFFVAITKPIDTSFTPRNATAQESPRLYVVLVNGYEDCCVWNPENCGVYMEKVLRELKRREAEFRLVPIIQFRSFALSCF